MHLTIYVPDDKKPQTLLVIKHCRNNDKPLSVRVNTLIDEIYRKEILDKDSK